jgi:radical SAM superfamily enzyme YgiQ (UPF0313 family)
MHPLRILLLTPPMTQLNTPYPATAYLTGFLRQHQVRLGFEVTQADPALELFLRVFSRDGIAGVLAELRGRVAELESDSDSDSDSDSESEDPLSEMPESIASFLECGDRYVATVEAVVRFLQGRDPSLAMRIAGRQFLPEGPRFGALVTRPGDEGAADDPVAWAFGALGVSDRAKHLASLYIDDLADVMRDGIDPNFELSRYGERLAAAAPSFDPLHEALEGEPTMIDELLDQIATELVEQHQPDLVGLTVPFPGNVYGALRIARAIKRHHPSTRIALGGGYVNTELRELSEPRLFDYVDYVTLLALIEHLVGQQRVERRRGDKRAIEPTAEPLAEPTAVPSASTGLFRTFVREDSAVVLRSDPAQHDVPLRDAGTPTYDGLALDRYLSLFEMLNPMHRLWSDGRWNKLTVAHGCYWKKCTFCDVTLDYIGRYDPVAADLLVDRVEALIAETGQSGFHFVDEAAPPSGLRALAERLLARQVVTTWWGNIRFEKAFTPDLVALLASSGCVAVSGGLEVASDRLLQLINKGVTVAQVARVTRAFADAGVMVHAYLMYGFPTETAQETVDSLELVRQLFVEGCVQSAFWHRFAATVHSPIGKQPELFGIRLHPLREAAFAKNDVGFDDLTGVDHDTLGEGLRRALYNYMHGVGLDEDVRSWFAAPGAGSRSRRGMGRQVQRVPAASVPSDVIRKALASR